MKLERFPIDAQIEVRAANGKRTIHGYAAVFNKRSVDFGGWQEEIAPGAFTESLGGDIRALWNHDDSVVLGRTKSRTLRVAEDERGLRVEIDPPASAAMAIESIERGDVDQMSFGFYVDTDAWRSENGKTIRTLLKVRLVEVSPVAFPAYPDTSVGVRALYGELPDIPESIRRAPAENPNQQDAGASTEKGIETRKNPEGETMKRNAVELRRDAAQQLARANELDAVAEANRRLLTEEERAEYDACISENQRLLESAVRAEQLEAAGGRAAGDGSEGQEERGVQAPNFNRHYKRGDNEARAIGAYIKRGDGGGLLAVRASNDTDMNITTPADGGYAVPVGHYNEIVSKRDENLLAPKLGVRLVPGKGTTVNVIVESGTTNPAIVTAEGAAYDRDAPGIAQVTMTLEKVTKKVELTEELLEDEDTALMSFVEQYVGRGFAATENAKLVAAAGAVSGGATIKSLTGTTASKDDIVAMVYGLKAEYADGAKWLMSRVTEGLYRGLTGDGFQFAPTPGAGRNEFWEFPKFNTSNVPNLAASAKCLYFGDWYFVGVRRAGGMTMLRDPYSVDGKVFLKYRQRLVYKMLLPEAMLLGQKAAS